jgi:hypothetical protein
VVTQVTQQTVFLFFFDVCVRLCVSVANSLILIFLLLAPVVTHAYYKPIALEPAAEVIVKFQQEAGADPDRLRWGFCSLGDPAHPEAMALRKLGANATALFIMATDYPFRTYLEKTPLEYNLRYAVGQKLEDEAQIQSDIERLRESRDKFKKLLKDLNISMDAFKASLPHFKDPYSEYSGPKTIATPVRSIQDEAHGGQRDNRARMPSSMQSENMPIYQPIKIGHSSTIGVSTFRGSDVIKSHSTANTLSRNFSRDQENDNKAEEQHLPKRDFDIKSVDPILRYCFYIEKWIRNNWQYLFIGFAVLAILTSMARK